MSALPEVNMELKEGEVHQAEIQVQQEELQIQQEEIQVQQEEIQVQQEVQVPIEQHVQDPVVPEGTTVETVEHVPVNMPVIEEAVEAVTPVADSVAAAAAAAAVANIPVPEPVSAPLPIPVPPLPTVESLQNEVETLKQENVTLTIQLEQMMAENVNLKEKLQKSGLNVVNGNAVQGQDSATATAAAAAQLTTYQNALALSESQKQAIMNENQHLRQRLAQSGISTNDVISPVPLGTPNGDEAAAAAATIDITEAEALAPIDLQNQHHHNRQNEMPMTPMTPNTAGLSSRSEEKWEMHFNRLTQYKNEHGNCLVPTSTELGRWLCRQRHNFRYKNIKEDRKQRLMELDKTCLGERIAELGAMAKDGEEATMTADGSTAGPSLSTKTKYNQAYESKLHAKWDKFFQQLVAYKEENGHCNFPTMNGSLGRWISRQRTLFRSQKLKADRYEKLQNIGFAFEDATALEFKGKLDQQWEAMYQTLLEHKEEKGHCFDVPETLPLGKWLYRQRWLYRHGNLREDRAEKLLSVGFEDKKVLKKQGGSTRKKRKRDAGDDELDAANKLMENVTESIEVPALSVVENGTEEVLTGQVIVEQHPVMEVEEMKVEEMKADDQHADDVAIDKEIEAAAAVAAAAVAEEAKGEEADLQHASV